MDVLSGLHGLEMKSFWRLPISGSPMNGTCFFPSACHRSPEGSHKPLQEANKWMWVKMEDRKLDHRCECLV